MDMGVKHEGTKKKKKEKKMKICSHAYNLVLYFWWRLVDCEDVK